MANRINGVDSNDNIIQSIANQNNQGIDPAVAPGYVKSIWSMFGVTPGADGVDPAAATRSAQSAASSTTGQPVTESPPSPDTVKVNGKPRSDLVRIDDNTTLDRIGSRTVTMGTIRGYQEAAQRSGNQARIDAANQMQARYGVIQIGTQGGKAVYAAPRSTVARAASIENGGEETPLAGGNGGGSGTNTGSSAIPGFGGDINGMLRSITGASTAGGVSGIAGGLSGLGSTGSILGAGALGLGATRGMAFQMNKVVRSVAASYSDSQFIGMLHSGLNIEALIYYFMAYASDKYDKKLREKMEEWTLAEQQQDAMERNKSVASTLSGILSLAGPAGIAAGYAVTAGVDAYNRASSALSGSTKSSTVLMQEVQILIQQWKVVQDLTSNLSKDLHDMAMTAVRNLR